MAHKKGEILTDAQAAKFLNISQTWLRASRSKNPQWAGPKFTKRNGWRIEYLRSDLVAFQKMREARTRVVDPADRMRSAQGKGDSR